MRSQRISKHGQGRGAWQGARAGEGLMAPGVDRADLAGWQAVLQLGLGLLGRPRAFGR